MFTRYEKECLTALYASLDFMQCNDLDSSQVIKAINHIEENGAASKIKTTMNVLVAGTEYTPIEFEMIGVFFKSSVDDCGSCDKEQNMSYSTPSDLKNKLGWSINKVGGVISSLLKKQAIEDTMEGDFVLCDDSLISYLNK
jgi:hypothetical protein